MIRRISLTIAVSDDGTKCAPECPHRRIGAGCRVFGALFLSPDLADADDVALRDQECINAERDAHEAEACAMEAGFGIADREAIVDDVDGQIDWVPATEALDAELARIRGGGQ